ncbi:LCP family protein [Pectinatus sottacetonis]|uniref:LCP family protein n=1 Tax=Pectinatus sottacetonis TaxID=1002795 RepID=UPI0018C608CE|nr:LCP family protein [Pectinatus sottacetonis]
MANDKNTSFPQKKRTRIVRKRRHPKFLRIILFLILLGFILFGIMRGVQYIYKVSIITYNYLETSYTQYKTAKQLKEKNIMPVTVPIQYNEITNVLFIGIDNYKNLNSSADSLMLFSINHTTGIVSVLIIPSNTVIAQNNTSYITAASVQQQGTQKTLDTLSRLLDIRINQYVIMDKNTFVRFIDIFNNINMYIGTNMNYDDKSAHVSIHLQQGYQHIDGQKALEYFQYRSDDLGDIGKAHRQKEFMKNFFTDILTFSSLPKVFSVASIINKSLITNTALLSFTNICTYLRAVYKNTFIIQTLPGHFSPDGKYWLPDNILIDSLTKKMFL